MNYFPLFASGAKMPPSRFRVIYGARKSRDICRLILDLHSKRKNRECYSKLKYLYPPENHAGMLEGPALPTTVPQELERMSL